MMQFHENRNVDVNIVILNGTNGQPVLSRSVVENHWKIVNERFAQVGVKVNWTIQNDHANPPAGVDFINGFTIRDPLASSILAPEAKSLITGYGTTSTTADIHVFYVNWIQGGLAGTSVGRYRYTASSESPYLDNIVIGANRYTFTPAHELGHLLINWGYLGESIAKTNLMYEGQPFTVNNNVFAKKRLNVDQQKKIRDNAHVH
jgi:hypothetical protein